MKLLSTVPQDASVVAVFEPEMLPENGGNGELGKTILKIFGSDAVNKDIAVSFVYNDRVYITGLVSDQGAFRKLVGDKSTGETFISGNVAQQGDCFWIRLDGGNVSSGDIDTFLSITEEESFAGKVDVDRLTSGDSDIAFMADVRSILENMDISCSDQVMMGLSVLFNDAAWVAGDINIDRQKLDFTLSVLDSKCKDAEWLFPAGKIDTSVFRYLKQGNVLMAIALPKELVDRIADLAVTAGAGGMMRMFKGVDGTAAFSFCQGMSDVSGVITASTPAAATDLEKGMTMFAGGMKTSVDDKYFIFSGIEDTPFSMKDVSDLDGALFGIMARNTGNSSGNDLQDIRVMVKNDGKRLAITGTCCFANGSDIWKNILNLL